MNCDLKTLKAIEVMNDSVQWAKPQENLRAAAERMAGHGIRALLVAGAEPTDLPGILTSKDIVNLICSHDVSVLDQLHVEDATTRPAVCVPGTANLLDCINLMRMSGVRRLPVLDGTAVIGVLSLSDVFARLLRC
ncbi:MAG: CBS domain-containing protein [Planctomycetes bacterium]|nr:CBS domain-containing protein [Planctomycetota bacterium]